MIFGFVYGYNMLSSAIWIKHIRCPTSVTRKQKTSACKQNLLRANKTHGTKTKTHGTKTKTHGTKAKTHCTKANVSAPPEDW